MCIRDSTTCGEATAEGICLEATQLNDFNGFMKNYRGDQNPNPGWSVDWKIRDVSHAPEHDTNVHIRYTDLTESAEGYLADGWHAFDYNSGRQGYLTRAVTRRSNKDVYKRQVPWRSYERGLYFV